MMPELLQQLSNSFVADWLWWGIGIGVTIVATIGYLWWKAKTQTARYLYNVAIDLYHKGRLQEALKILEKAFKKEPNYQPVLYNIGVIYMELGDNEIAKNYFQLSILEIPDDTSALYNVGLIEYEAESYEEAISSWLACIQHSDEIDPDVYYGLGLAYEGMEQWQTALEVYERNVELNPEHIDSKIATARLAYELGDIHYAKRLLDELLAVDEENQDTLLYAALVAVALEDWDSGESFATQLLTLDDEHAHAFNILGVVYFYQKRYEDAEECFEAALELDEEWVSPMNNLAYVYEKQGRLTHAKMRFKQVQGSEALTPQLETDSYWMIRYLKDPEGAEALQAERLATEAEEEANALLKPLFDDNKIIENGNELIQGVMTPTATDELVEEQEVESVDTNSMIE
jgi:tetratricopeptide (TPR) repeat protein